MGGAFSFVQVAACAPLGAGRFVLGCFAGHRRFSSVMICAASALATGAGAFSWNFRYRQA
jgi:hypothetical protein